MRSVSVSTLLRYGSQFHGDFEKISEGETLLVTRHGAPHVVLASGKLAKTIASLKQAERRFNRMTRAKQCDLLINLISEGHKCTLQDLVQRLAEKPKTN
jgi:hypothetical protein